MDKKFELTDETTKYCGRTLYRIKALKDFDDVKEGDLGGWVEKEENLSQEGECWIYDDAIVCGNALVSGDARVFANAQVYGSARVHCNARVGGNALVYCNARVFDNAWVYDNTIVYGNALVSGGAQVCDRAWVRGNAHICGNAEVCGNARISGYANIQDTREYFTVGPAGSGNRFTTFYRARGVDKEDVGVTCGCSTETLDEFEKKVETKHGDNGYGKQYKILIELARVRFGLSKRVGWLGRLFQQHKRKKIKTYE